MSRLGKDLIKALSEAVKLKDGGCALSRQDEAEYLLPSPANAERLKRAVRELDGE